jgi:protein CpxP
MSTSNNRSLIVIITVLLLTNIAVLGYFLWFKKQPELTAGTKKTESQPHDERKGIEGPLQDSVGFNENQLVQYRQMRDEQRKAIKPMFEDMRKMRDSLFRLISNEKVDDAVVNSLTGAIAQTQKDLDLRMFNYFKKLRGVCTPDQLPKYDSVILRMMNRMGRPHKDQDKKNDK